MKTDRLLAETIYLLQRGRVTSRQMAERFEVSRRTILRDMDALSLAGIPITSLDGAGGGYQLEESYQLDHRAADRQDVELILVALRALSTAMDDSQLQSAIEKFQPLEKESGAEPLSVDLSVLNESARVQRNLRALRRAIREKSVVRITYVSAAGREAMHEVEPLRLDYRWYAWYLTAWSRRHDKPVTFKLIRMDGVEPTGERCPERPPVERGGGDLSLQARRARAHHRISARGTGGNAGKRRSAFSGKSAAGGILLARRAAGAGDADRGDFPTGTGGGNAAAQPGTE